MYLYILERVGARNFNIHLPQQKIYTHTEGKTSMLAAVGQ